MLRASKVIVESINRLRSPKKLLQVYEAVKNRLYELEISTNHTDPVGQYAEYLVSKLYDAKKTTNATAGCDLISHDNKRIEVKGRVSRKDGYVPKTTFRESNVIDETFDYLVYVVFDPDYNVKMAFGMTIDTFKSLAEVVYYKNSTPKRILKASAKILENDEVDDLTSLLSEYQ